MYPERYWRWLKSVSPTPGAMFALIFLSYAVPAIFLVHTADALGKYIFGK